ncbi:MAG: DUF4870 domain-containing protein [Actinomycetia bacterium]|nr:DUF4870 domain-containing protein [Actinomycetes bacterium]
MTISTPPPAVPSPASAPVGAPAVPSPDERTWAMLSHLLTFVSAWIALGVVWPLLVLLTRGRQPGYVHDQAAESVNFQLTMLVAAVVSAALVPLLIGIPMLLAVGVWYVVWVLRASFAANRGEAFRYPLVVRIAG